MHGCSPRYILYGVVSGEHLCRSYCTTTGVHGGFAPEATLSPPSFVASDFEDEDNDDGDDDDASDDADGDASSTDKMST